MRWPWQAPVEQRADSSYTDALIASITANAGGQTTAFPTATAALEACVGFVGRAFATAEIKAPGFATTALDPATLSMIGRALIRRGEILFLIRVDRDGLLLLPAASYDVNGGPDPASWEYRLTIGGPERTHTYSRQPAESVLHFTYGRDPERPWRGPGLCRSRSLPVAYLPRRRQPLPMRRADPGARSCRPRRPGRTTASARSRRTSERRAATCCSRNRATGATPVRPRPNGPPSASDLHRRTVWSNCSTWHPARSWQPAG